MPRFTTTIHTSISIVYADLYNIIRSNKPDASDNRIISMIQNYLQKTVRHYSDCEHAIIERANFSELKVYNVGMGPEELCALCSDILRSMYQEELNAKNKEA